MTKRLFDYLWIKYFDVKFWFMWNIYGKRKKDRERRKDHE